ncbi:hypothetical protein HDU81_003731 [Chytriomyces hyalinus]|nr:hypothetical protein HDU81_003731 [Chytriomyces hyalinus]
MDFTGLEALALAAANASASPNDTDPDAVSLPSFSRLLAKLPQPPPHETPSLTQHISRPSPEPLSAACLLLPNLNAKSEVSTAAALSAIPMHLHVYTDSQATQIDPKTNMQFKKLVDSPVSMLATDSRIADLQKDSAVGTSVLVSPTSSTGASPPAHNARIPPVSSTTTRGTARKRETSRRYRLNKSQVACLTHLFNLDPNPSSVTHGRVANVTGMPRKAVRLWFQNARAKLRREARTTGFQDPATPYELRKYQLFQQQQQQHQQQQQLGGSESPAVEVVPVLTNGGYRSYEVPDMVLRGMTEIAEDVNTALDDYVRGAFGTVARVTGRASSSSRSTRQQLDDDEAGDDDSDETEVDDDEGLSGDDVAPAAK